MAAVGWVDIVHPSGLTSSVLASTLPAWESAGWTAVENGSEGVVVPIQTPPPSPEQQGEPPSD